MQTLQHKISDKIAQKYRAEAISAASDYGVELTKGVDLTNNLDRLCLKIHGDLEYIRTQEILMDSIAIKNASIVYLDLKDKNPDLEVEWYQNDAYYGTNTYPVKFGSVVIFPKQWFKDAIESGKAGRFKEFYDESVTEGSPTSAGELSVVDSTEIKRLLAEAEKLIPELESVSNGGIKQIQAYVDNKIKSHHFNVHEKDFEKLGIILGEYIRKDFATVEELRWHYGKTASGGESTYFLSATSSSGVEFYPIDWVKKYRLNSKDSIEKKYKDLVINSNKSNPGKLLKFLKIK